MTLFRGVSVLLDRQPPGQGPMAHACEWAGRLHLPLRTVPDAPPRGDFFRPSELNVCGGALLATAGRIPRSAVLSCPPSWRPLSRVLILNHRAGLGDGYVDTVAALCLSFQAAPVVLTVARTAAEAKTRERVAEEAFDRRGLNVDCDLITGCDLATAVARAARWRRCAYVFVERRPAARWTCWLQRDVLRELAGLADSLSLLVVPDGRVETELPPLAPR